MRKLGEKSTHLSPENAAMHEARLREMEARIASGEGSGRYPVGLFRNAGRFHDDREEYGERYTGRQARSHRQPGGSLGDVRA